MLDHAFTFVVGEANWRSRKEMERIGGVLRDEIVEQTIHGTTYRDVIFEIRKSADGVNAQLDGLGSPR